MYDDDESYFVAARFTDEAAARRLRDRLFEAHTAADGDGCHLDSSWMVETVPVNETDPDVPLPLDLFDASREYDDHHAEVNIDRLPLARQRLATGSEATPEDTEVSDWSDPKFRKAAGEVLIDWLLIAFFFGLVVGFALGIASR